MTLRLMCCLFCGLWAGGVHAESAAVDRLSAALRIATVSVPAPQSDFSAFQALNTSTKAWFPRASELLAGPNALAPSRLYFWPGSDPALEPILLLAHLDVVPVGAPENWTYPAFSGAVAKGFIWGRGSLDDKSNALAHLEALESLLAEGFQPKRGIWVAHGHDEELDGNNGARRMAAWLERQGVQAWFSLDEGGAVTQGVAPGVRRPVATIMAGEKGYLSVRLTAHGSGGHSSTPAPGGAIERLTTALQRLQDQPMPPRLIPPVARMLEDLAPAMSWPSRVLISLRRIFEPLLIAKMSANPTAAATVRTTMAFTMLKAGVKDNVLPTSAEAVINFRLLPGDEVADVLAYLDKTIDDEQVSVDILPGFSGNAPALAQTTGPAMDVLRTAVQAQFPEAIITTGIVVATTDNRHYARVRRNGYYFSPYPYRNDDAGRIHGTDERIAAADYLRMIEFYKQLIRDAAS